MIIPNAIIHDDCLEIMKQIHSNSIDMILCDLPYNMTRTKWDIPIPLDKLWLQYERIIKDTGAIVLTASQPFTSLLISSNLKLFKYNWVWEKSRGSNCVHSKFQPLKVHEDICVFSKAPAAQNKKWQMNYFPILAKGKPYNKGLTDNEYNVLQTSQYKKYDGNNETGNRFPRSVIYFNSDSDGKERGLHPTQKPIKLLEYLIKTYTKEKDIVLDNCMGSGSTPIACINTNRLYIGIELDTNYFNIANKRIEEHKHIPVQENLL